MITMRRWVFGVILVIALAVTVGWGWRTAPNVSVPNRVSVSPTPTPSSPTPSASPASPPVTAPAPQIDAVRLFRHVQALSFERYTDRDRARTRDYIAQVLRSFGWEPQLQAFEGGVNLVAQHPGTDPTAGAILVTAHYDTVQGSPGADDNATSIAAALEVARLLGPHPTRRSLRLAFFDQEELGLKGSLAYTAMPANLTDLLAVVNLEMLGYACHTPGCQMFPEGLPIQPPSDRGDFLGIAVDQEHVGLLSAFQSSQSSESSQLPPLLSIPVPFKGLLTPDLLRSDHAPFWARNIGAVVVADTANFRNPHYHQPSDIPDTLDRSFFTGSAQVVLNAVNRLLDRREF